MARIYLNDFEHLNTTTESIYELREFNVLIILTNGTNLTNWDDVENREDIQYISEDLFGETHLAGRYKGLKNLKAIVTFGVGNVASTRDMFSGCESLVEISSLSKWDVSRVNDVSNMFKGCSSLENISPLANWNMSSVIDMSCMFMGCSSIEDISPLANWDVSNVDDMHYLFSDCRSIRNVSALRDWDVGNVKDMGCLFQFCTSLDNISALKYWDLSNVFNVTAFFRGCVSLKDISAVSNWDLSAMTRNKSLLSVFSYCTSLKNISPLKSWDMSNINRISGLFEGCSQIKNISALKDWDVSNITSFEFLFKNCSALTNISALQSWDISDVRSLKSMFNGCELLTDISQLKSWDVSKIKSMEGMFKSCDSLVDISSLNDWKVADDANIDSLFDYCEMIEDYPLWFKIRVLKDKDSNPEVRQKIIKDLDESFFRSYDLNNFDDITQLFIAQNSTDQSFLAYIVDRSKIKPVQEITLDRITDENVLTDIAIHDHNYDIMPSEKPSNGLNYKFYFYNRENALLKIKNRELLIKIAKESQYIPENMSYMVEHVDTEEEWIDIVLNSKSPDVRMFAFDVLESEDAFQRIIDESSDEEILAKAQEKIKVEEEVSQT